MSIVLAKSVLKDDWRKWAAEYCPAPRDGFDRDGYQKRLDEITGLSRGRSILRLEWGGEEQVSKYGAMELGNPNPSQLIFEPKYKLRRKYMGATVMVPFRRWVIAQLAEWEEYGYGDDTQTTFTDENGVLRRAADKPRDLYTPLIYVGDHRSCKPDCCADKLCPGDYKHPDAAELFWVLESTYKLKTERIKDPRQKDFNPQQMQIIRAEYAEQQQKKKEEFDKRLETIEL
jgi:hypothetical protein